MFRSFFPNPRIFFPAALGWTALCMVIWYTVGPTLQGAFSLGPWIGVPPTEAAPEPFFSPDKVWLYQFILLAGYAFCVPWYWIGGNRRWFWWSVVGSVTIIEVVYFNVQINAWLNDWYGDFYDLIQRALTAPNTITLDEYLGRIWTVIYVLVPNITVLVLNLFFTQHYLFRWRRAMTFFYMSHWPILRNVEGASQRVQEDTRLFASIVEDLATTLVSSVMTLIVFLPLLYELSGHITEVPFIGRVDAVLVWLALISAAFGTVLLWLVGWRLPGLEFNNQRVEAAFRKELVYAEDHPSRGQPLTIRDFFLQVQKNYFRLYFNYLYFNVARYAYLQMSTFIPYIAMGPSIVGAVITFGLFQQILNAFNQVEESFKFLANSWTTIIRLISVYKRLRLFEANVPPGSVVPNDYDDPRFLESWRVEEVSGSATPGPAPAQ